jgi:hypothetical protein
LLTRFGRIAGLIALACALIPASASAAPTSLGAFWHLDESTGAFAADDSANANDGAIDGAAHVAGRFNRALRFDGVDDDVLIPRSASLEPATITVEGWVRAPTSPGNFRYVIVNSANGCLAPSYGIYTATDGGLAFVVSGGDDSTDTASPAAPATVWDGAWHHVAGTFDGATVRLYVDGVEVGNGTPASVPIAYGLPTSTDTRFGMFGGTCTLPYAGDLDEPRIWARAMSSTEVAASAAMGRPSTTELDAFTDAGDSVAYTKRFSSGTAVISTESASATERITTVRIVGLLPLTSRATCRNDLVALLSATCDIGLSNGDRTASVTVRPLLFRPTVTLRVWLSSGRSFDVQVQT